MKSDRQIENELRELAEQVFDIVVANSAGDGSRGVNWRFFVKAIPHTIIYENSPKSAFVPYQMTKSVSFEGTSTVKTYPPERGNFS